MLRSRLFLFLVSVGALTHTGFGQMQIFHVEPAKSAVHFGLGDPLHAVNGTFHIESGSFTFDTKEGTMGGKISVDAESGISGNKTRDRKMAEDELKAPTYRSVTFAPKRYRGTLAASGESTITIEGVFSLMGTPHEISVPMVVQRNGPTCKATGSFQVPYVKWGLKDPSVFLLRVGKEVKIDLVLVGSVEAERR